MTATTATWHWQEKFEPADVEGACQRQILKIRRPKSYGCWLKEKTRASSKDSLAREAEADDDCKQAEIDAAFREWLRRKRTGKKQKQGVDPGNEPKPWCKPPSLHVNPKKKQSSSRRAECPVAMSNNQTYLRGTESESQQAYKAWLARVRQEDHVRRAQRREELKRLEQQQREKHKITWRKKLAVCAYSTLAVDS